MKITPRLLTRKGQLEGMLQMVIYHNGVQKEFSLKRRIPVDQWDAKSKKAIGNNNINMLIRRYKRQIEDRIDNCTLKGEIVNLNDIVMELFDHTGKKKDSSGPIKLVDFINSFIEENPQSLKPISLKSYYTLKSHILTIDPKITIADVDQLFIKKLVSYLESIGNKVNSVATKLKKLRKILGLAYRKGLIAEIPFGKDKYQIRVQKNVKRRYLSADEEQHLLEYVPANKTEKKVMDLIRFNLNVGLRIRDLLLLKVADFTINRSDSSQIEIRLNKRTNKNDSEVDILMVSKSATILLEYQLLTKRPNDIIFDWIKPSKLLNEIATDKEVSSKTTLFNQSLKSICKKIEIPKISSHSLRHTLATKLLSKDIPIASISSILGHKSITTTQIYAKVVQDTLDSHIIKALE